LTSNSTILFYQIKETTAAIIVGSYSSDSYLCSQEVFRFDFLADSPDRKRSKVFTNFWAFSWVHGSFRLLAHFYDG